MKHVGDVLRIRNRFMRSINVERDYGNGSLQDYIWTSHTRATLTRLVQSLAAQSCQRAWRITGDFGTGKSSFAVVLAQLLSNGHQRFPLSLRQAIDFRQLGIGRPHLLPILVTGSREPIVVAVLRALKRALEGYRSRGGPRPQILEKISSRVSATATPVSDATVIDLLEAANDYVCGTGKGTGLLVILDELGKFLEFAALHPDRQDIFFLQSLAEAASRSGKRPLVVVGLLHQGFNAYAEQLPQVAQKEWEKVAGRFEELLFNQPIEQTVELVAYALDVRKTRLPYKLIKDAKRDMVRAIEIGWYGPTATHQTLTEISARLYPLHPTILPVLVRLFSRFGQNERSLFSFLLSDEPFALQEFATRPLASAPFYRIHHLYDYARVAFGSRLSVQSYRSHWNQIESVVESFPREDNGHIQILKTVALLNLLDIPNLVATESAIAAAVGNGGRMSERWVKDALRYLTLDKHVLYNRGAGGYCLWPHTSVNLEKAYHEACRAVATPERISSVIREDLETRPLVARRHYIETGNLRHFNVRYASMSELPALDGADWAAADGCIIIPLCESDAERQEALAFARSAAVTTHPAMLVAIPKPLGALGGLVHECQRWQWISQNVPELNHDSYAAEEVSRQLEAARQMLEKRISSYIGLRQFTETMELQWFHRGSSISVRSGRELLAFLSQICDETYNLAPQIRNELINRHVVSSAAAAARMRLIERILRFQSQPLLGMEPAKKPPEMSIYLSVLRHAALHREVDGTWAITEPSSKYDPCKLRPIFQRMREILEETPDGRVRVSDLFSQLRRPPYGVRDGLGPLLLAVFSVVHEQSVAFYETGVFLRNLSGLEFLRLIKVPTSFEVQYCRIAGVRAAVFEKLRKLLLPNVPSQRKSDVLDVVRPLCQFAAQLPAFTHRTRTLSAEASSVREALLHAEEPAVLLFRQLPRACGFQEFETDHEPSGTEVLRFVEELKLVLAELKSAYPGLLRQMETTVITAFERPGSFSEVRHELSAVAGKLLVAVTEPSLKAFCFRVADASLSDSAWVESLGSLLCGKPPYKWLDADTESFREEIKRFARQFQRVEAMMFDVIKDKGRSAIRIAVTQPDGVEVDHVLHVAREEETQAAEIEALIEDILNRTSRVGLVAATRALGKAVSAAMGPDKSNVTQSTSNGRKTT